MVANRVRNSSSSVYASLERFLNSLKLPFLTSIHDSESYLHAAEKGLGVFEMDAAATIAERKELMPILDWMNGQFPDTFGSRLEGDTSPEVSRKFAMGTQSFTVLSSTSKSKGLP